MNNYGLAYFKKLLELDDEQPFCIENGYFIFTMMPSLKCSLNCPHCYLSLEQRRNSETMTLENLEVACKKVDDYYKEKQIKNKIVIFYWYGGEPTEMGIDYLENSMKIINSVFTKEKGYTIKNTVLTSLLTINTEVWFKFFKENCDNHFQTSFDGLMRGKNYVRKWEEKVKLAINDGVDVGTISVVNNELLMAGATKTMQYLTDLRVKEVSFLPFMWNEQNNGLAYNKYAPTMNAWSDFMIEAAKFYFEKKMKNEFVPEVGQIDFVLHQMQKEKMANLPAQTLFLLPNGDFVLPDYKNGYQEYMRVFGNILKDNFENVLKSPERRSYLRKQVLRDENESCLNCEHANKCVMEFWKKNRDGDDCFGGKKFIEWLLAYVKENNIKIDKHLMY